MSHSLSDSAILDRLRRGDEGAFESLFRTWYPELVGVAERMLGDRSAGEEVVQDVLLQLWQKRDSLSIRTSIRAYLYRSVRNRSLNELRHERVARMKEPHLAADGTAQPAAPARVIEAEMLAALHRAMAELPPRCREVFELSRVHGLQYREIADTLEISVKTVEAQMGKALRIMRDRLASWLPGAEDGPVK